jgi:hypothetical protein
MTLAGGDYNPTTGQEVIPSIAMGGLFYELAQNGIVANPGGGQTNATLITGQTARVTTVATLGDSVKLPAAVAGLEVLLINRGVNAMQVFGSGTDTIDGVATAVGVSQMQNSTCIYTCAVNGLWETEGLATGFGQSGLQTLSQADGLVAHAGGGQANGTPLTTMLNRVATVATTGDSVLLPVSKPGMVVTVLNGAGNSMNVFPATGEAINALGANAAFAAATLTVTIFYCLTAGQWFTK